MQILKEPILLDWATENIIEDQNEHINTIKTIFDALQPWLNIDLYNAIKKQEEKEKQKMDRITRGKASENQVVTVNAIDAFLRRRGIKVDK